ncbi:S9 family peptidase [Bdellovibrio sp. qaytius]|nr:S9 family peptidase [Bdellovibrio sp. qaytius]
MKNIIALFFCALVFNSCSLKSNSPNDPLSKNLDYLEEIESPQVKRFAEVENVLSIARLKTDPLFSVIEKEITDVVTAKDKLPMIMFLKHNLYQFWQDQDHVRGQFKTISLADYNAQKNNWQVAFDLDVIAKAENKNWVWKGMNCFKKNETMCLVFLSNGGKDAVVAREYDLEKREFVKDGFSFPESKSQFEWYDENTLLWADATNPDKLTTSGYPQTLKFIKRGQKLDDATFITDAPKDYVSIDSWVVADQDKLHFLVSKSISFYENELFYLADLNSQKLVKIPIPIDAEVRSIYKDHLLYSIKSDYAINGKTYPPGTLLSFPLFALQNMQTPEVVFVPSATEFLQSTTKSKDQLWLSTLNDVKRSLIPLDRVDNHWVLGKFKHGLKNHNNGNWSITAIDSDSNQTFFNYTDFLTPVQVYYSNDGEKSALNLKAIQTAPERFNAKNLTIEQFKAKSKDGTLVPYFVVHAKNIKLNGKNPTLQYGYGGFEASMTPYYLGVPGKVWLSRGNVYVLANIRGGGEYGPNWHKSAQGVLRQKSFDDFIAVSEDLIKRKITSPEHLGIMGGSNGGLLTSVMLTQRPDLFGAVVSEVPLTNMIRFNKLLAGASWQGEYGNPDIPAEREVLMKYSPLHNIKPNVKYPEAFYITSTKDDRVHPAHARQMVTRLKQMGHSVLYFENIDGGHGRAANLKEYATMLGMEYTYLFQKLSPKK